MKVRVFADFEEAFSPEIHVDTDKNVELVIDVAIQDFLKPIPENTIRIFATIQPEGHYHHLINANQGCFDYLISSHPGITHLPKCVFMIGCTAFVPPNANTKNKKFGVSAIFSGRNVLPGHVLRHELWERREEIIIPRFFYVGERTRIAGIDYSKELSIPATKDAKKVAMECMFHIAIDSYETKDLFSEKLIDPLISSIIPIYWGAENVYEYFDMKGIFHVGNVDDMIMLCNRLNETDYNTRIQSIKSNYNKAMPYANYAERLKSTIQSILNP